MKLIDKINNAANEYNKTKDEKYKKMWKQTLQGKERQGNLQNTENFDTSF